MYSSNVAYEAGRRLGRQQPDIWLSDEQLWVAVQQEIAPQVRPRSGANSRNAQEWQGTVTVLTVLSVGGIVLLLAIGFYRQAEWMPETLSKLRTERWWWAVFSLVFITLLASIHSRRVTRRAKAERRRLREQLCRAAYAGAAEVVTARRNREHRTSSVLQRQSQDAAAYSPRSGVDLTPRQAEELAARWMRSLGARKVEVTQFRGDGGVDVSSLRHIAQVKHLSGNVGVAPVRELSGVVRVDGRRGLFFTTSGYSTGAIEFAHQSGIALFRMDLRTGQLIAVNEVAKSLQLHGLA